MKTRQSSNYIFEGPIKGKHLSDNAMLTFLKRNFPNIEAVPHGFRSSFRDWAETRNAYSYRAMEYCLGHEQNKLKQHIRETICWNKDP